MDQHATGSTTAAGTPWPDLLDALEEQTSRLLRALQDGERDVQVPDLELDPDGPLPPELRLRAQALLQAMQELQRCLARLTGQSARAAAAYASH